MTDDLTPPHWGSQTMTDAPELIYVEMPEVFDAMGFWQERPSADLVPYTRADLIPAMIAAAYRDAANQCDYVQCTTGSDPQYATGEYLEDVQPLILTRTPADAKAALAAIEGAAVMRGYERGKAEVVEKDEAYYGVAIPAMIEAARRDALEEAAKVADYYADMDYCALNYPEECGVTASSTADMIRSAIRALATTPPTPTAVDAT